ncbi:WbqC-like protein family [Candidatus Ornithobacterium hominis]|uniref:WbqC family protein n=1 Tax=Candidatus Ornithobacterium hominis TaxID=2497989 RepID=UPI0024BCAABC|nr:WbqC family protein [Candidatus Ornithobacterium hominis]CAI9430206.1 WbqC-like protein family [Candidatus Ornithobacterium hominis]
MELPVFPLFYFPPIDFFLSLKKFKEFAIESEENYTKQTYRNRCCILGPNGKQSLSIPIKKGLEKKISLVEIHYENKWVAEHIKSIETAYRNAPFFLYYWDSYRNILKEKPSQLFDLNQKILLQILRDLKLNCSFSFTKSYQNEARHDFRHDFSAKVKSERKIPAYQQVFQDKFNFVSDLSILDLVFNLGPEAGIYIKNN